MGVADATLVDGGGLVSPSFGTTGPSSSDRGAGRPSSTALRDTARDRLTGDRRCPCCRAPRFNSARFLRLYPSISGSVNSASLREGSKSLRWTSSRTTSIFITWSRLQSSTSFSGR